MEEQDRVHMGQRLGAEHGGHLDAPAGADLGGEGDPRVDVDRLPNLVRSNHGDLSPSTTFIDTLESTNCV